MELEANNGEGGVGPTKDALLICLSFVHTCARSWAWAHFTFIAYLILTSPLLIPKISLPFPCYLLFKKKLINYRYYTI